MPKWLTTLFTLIFLIALTALAIPVHAQDTTPFANVSVAIWPEYDRPSVLVMYDLQVSPDAVLPASMTVRIPKDSELIAVAYNDQGQMLNTPFDSSEVQDGWRLIKFTANLLVTYRIEYYDTLNKSGAIRSYHYEWLGDSEALFFQVTYQEPRGAKNTVTNPNLGGGTMNADGLYEYGTQVANLSSGQPFTLDIQYEKNNDDLTATGSGVQPSAPLVESSNGRLDLSTLLPWLLGGLGALLIVFGILYFRQTSQGSGQSRKRHTSRQAESDEGTGVIYCHECGKRAQTHDRFCRTCGTRLRT